MSKIKNVIIYVLSVILAFMCGIGIIIMGMLATLGGNSKDREEHNDRNYRNYYDRRRGA